MLVSILCPAPSTLSSSRTVVSTIGVRSDDFSSCAVSNSRSNGDSSVQEKLLVDVGLNIKGYFFHVLSDGRS